MSPPPKLRTALILLLGISKVFAAEVDSRMVPPRNAVTGKLPAAAPISPVEAASTFQVLDDFQMDLLASEPLVASPVAMAYDENGRAYVCEMRDYPYTDKARHQRNQENPTDAPIGTVRLLEDIDGDGIFDKATIFADELSWPTGVACWKGGVFVAATPDIWYLKDTDGDGKADFRRKVFTGFRKLNVQSVMNSLIWGLDNQIHGAGSSNGGQIRHAEKPDAKPLAIGRNDFRFDPVTENFELLSGGARFGVTFDDWGHRFLCDIRNPAQHVVLPQRYLTRNPYLAVASTLNDMAEAGDQLPVYRISPPEPWRTLRAKRWAGERDIVMPRSELVGAGVVTSSSGETCYRGAAYPEKYRGNIFVCECAGNLFYRLQLTPDGPTFKAARVDGKAEIVASRDNWFRPVNFVNAPDGTLHVTDMYRENIEHPWSIPDDIHAAVDLESGRDRGRIWRLSPPNFKAPKPPRLGKATTEELIATLENPNSWWRETAQRLLFERQDASAVAALRTMVKSGGTAQARLHALWALERLKSLPDEDVLIALRDSEAGVRENAVKLAEPRAGSPPVTEALLRLADDPDAFVRLQVAFTLGEIPDLRALDALARIARRDAANQWIRTAVLSSVANSSDRLLALLLGELKITPNGGSTELVRELAHIVGARGEFSELQRTLRAIGIDEAHPSASARTAVLGVGAGLKRSGKNLRSIKWDAATKTGLDQLLLNAQNIAGDSRASLEERIEGIQILAFDNFESAKTSLASLIDSQRPGEIQRAAVTAMGSFGDAEVGQILLSRWRRSPPAVRNEIILALLNGRARTFALLKAIESGIVPASQVPFARRANLLRSSDGEIKSLAVKIFGDAPAASRKEVIARYEAALSIQGDAVRGKAVFEKNCATCHRAGDIGKEVGPNLATIRQWNPEQVLINILDPNREVAPNFLGYTIEMKDGRTLDGIMAQESAASITLKRVDDVMETVLRRDIAEISGSGVSLMPEGLENTMSVEQMADLIAFLLAPL